MLHCGRGGGGGERWSGGGGTVESGMITDSFKCYPTGAAGLGLRSGGSADYNGGLHGTLSVVRESERERGGEGWKRERERERGR